MRVRRAPPPSLLRPCPAREKTKGGRGDTEWPQYTIRPERHAACPSLGLGGGAHWNKQGLAIRMYACSLSPSTRRHVAFGAVYRIASRKASFDVLRIPGVGLFGNWESRARGRMRRARHDEEGWTPSPFAEATRASRDVFAGLRRWCVRRAGAVIARRGRPSRLAARARDRARVSESRHPRPLLSRERQHRRAGRPARIAFRWYRSCEVDTLADIVASASTVALSTSFCQGDGSRTPGSPEPKCGRAGAPSPVPAASFTAGAEAGAEAGKGRQVHVRGAAA